MIILPFLGNSVLKTNTLLENNTETGRQIILTDTIFESTITAHYFISVNRILHGSELLLTKKKD